MRVLITGINGFIGKHLSKALTARGHKVRGAGNVLDRKQIVNDIGDADCVIHLAAKTSHKDIVENKFESMEINLLGTKIVLDAFINSKASKFIYPSSGKVYGRIKSLPIKESHPTTPLNTLGKSKLITEKLIDFYADNQKEFIIFRIFNVYGSDQRKNFLIPTILELVEKGKKEITLGDIDAKRDYIYIDDLVDAFVLAIEQKGKPGMSIYNICTKKASSAKEIVRIIAKIKGFDIKLRSNSDLYRADEMKDEYGSYEKAKKAFGWKPKFNIEEGLRKMITK